MAQTSSSPSTLTSDGSFPLPRITIRFCTQCKWMLRAAYFAQELLSTFGTSIGEVALQPSTGGTFVVEIFTQTPPALAPAPSDLNAPSTTTELPAIQQRVLWDRKVDRGFPETKELKRRVRDVIEPARNLGHVDRDYSKTKTEGGKIRVRATTPIRNRARKKRIRGGQQGPVCKAPATDAQAPREKCSDCT